MNSENERAIRVVRRLFFLVIFLSLISLAGIGTSVWFYLQLQDLKKVSVGTQTNTSDVASLVRDVGRYMVLPANEVPTVATVSDPLKLKDQPFFANAKTGDRVLIYLKARKAILWRPSTSQIIEVSPLTDSVNPSTN